MNFKIVGPCQAYVPTDHFLYASHIFFYYILTGNKQDSPFPCIAGKNTCKIQAYGYLDLSGIVIILVKTV